MVDSNANALEVNRFQQLCRLCASDTRSQTNGNGFDCKNSLNLIQTIKHLYGVQVNYCRAHQFICFDRCAHQLPTYSRQQVVSSDDFGLLLASRLLHGANGFMYFLLFSFLCTDSLRWQNINYYMFQLLGWSIPFREPLQESANGSIAVCQISIDDQVDGRFLFLLVVLGMICTNEYNGSM